MTVTVPSTPPTVTAAITKEVTKTVTKTEVIKPGESNEIKISYTCYLVPGSVIYVNPNNRTVQVLNESLMTYYVITFNEGGGVQVAARNAEVEVNDFGIDGNGLKAVISLNGSRISLKLPKKIGAEYPITYIYAPDIHALEPTMEGIILIKEIYPKYEETCITVLLHSESVGDIYPKDTLRIHRQWLVRGNYGDFSS